VDEQKSPPPGPHQAQTDSLQLDYAEMNHLLVW